MRGFQLTPARTVVEAQAEVDKAEDNETLFDPPTLSGVKVRTELELVYEEMFCETCQHTEMCLLHDNKE